jgi:hypothetical protein
LILGPAGKGNSVTEHEPTGQERKLWAVPATVGGVITAFVIVAAVIALVLWIV